MMEWLEPWAFTYRHSALAQAVVLFSHLAGILLAGGLAITTDRVLLRARVRPRVRLRAIRSLGRTHLFVILGLLVAMASGVARVLAEIGTYLPSWVFWLKMLLLAALLANGWILDRAVRGVRADLDGSGDVEDPAHHPDWDRVRAASARSAGLWAATALVGILLTTV